MTQQIIMHDKTEKMLDMLLAEPVSHAIGIEAPKGSGKRYVAHFIAKQIFQIEDIASLPYILEIDCGTETGIEQIRNIKSFLKLKVPSGSNYNRIVLLERCDELSIPAQNALLKIIEEPPDGTILLLLGETKKRLLPTIVSRLQWLKIYPVSLDILKKLFANKYDEPAITRAYSLSDGHIGLFLQILQEGSEHRINKAINLAKEILSSNRYQRLKTVDSIIKDDSMNIEEVLAVMQKMLRSMLGGKRAVSLKSQKELIKRMELIAEVQAGFKHNQNTKLVLTNLFYQL